MIQGRFIDGVLAKPHAVTIEVDQEGLWIIGDNTDFRQLWSASDLYIIDRHGDQWRLSCQGRGDARLQASYRILSKAIRQHHPAWQEGRSSMGVSPKLVAGLMALALLIVGGGVYIVPRLGDIIANAVPLSMEANWGKGLAANMDRLGDVCQHPDGLAALDKVTRRLRQSSLTDNVPVQLVVLDHSMVNAFAMPGGHIRLFRGLIDQAETPEEVAGILAHEIGHVAKRHVLARMVESMGLSLVIQTMTGGSVVGDASGFLLEMRYSRDKEQEADQYAVSLLNEVGLETTSLAAFFDRLGGHDHGPDNGSGNDQSQASTGGLWDVVPSLFSTHPASEDRSQWISSHGKTLTSTPPLLSSDEWRALQGICLPESEAANKKT